MHDFFTDSDTLNLILPPPPPPSEVITDQKTTFFSYIKSLGFYLDVLSVLPLEVFAVFWLPSGEQIRYVAVFRINRLLKLWKVGTILNSIIMSQYHWCWLPRMF